MVKSVLLPSDDHEAIGVEDDKLIHGSFPLLSGMHPICRDITQSQPEQLGGRLIAGDGRDLDDLPETYMQALDGIGRCF